MHTIDIAAFQNQLPNVLEAISRGEEVLLSLDGQPVAQLVAIPPRRELREPGSMAGQIWMSEDFDASVPEDILVAFEGK
ncbi:antitoxin (DNA-binding transcriptional repressor) of toxin-antitoxin stability system [Duganella sp. SG902]|uniref:type II toxin-antitoxin system Phd/YefM family antitoxin n=1 Tax=Duganella sp. SG902 TaxID=2587016 RepID=UPI00159DB54F|nr:type II toxin-antitoxin system Phd/YefM family antitoxin [Duganella sp. SG902]NVM76908.1 antitoxin (DNA-binding transcriptional repressor) of toxin-antitoxin stability system [Duganella sp. SG902]